MKHPAFSCFDTFPLSLAPALEDLNPALTDGTLSTAGAHVITNPFIPVLASSLANISSIPAGIT